MKLSNLYYKLNFALDPLLIGVYRYYIKENILKLME